MRIKKNKIFIILIILLISFINLTKEDNVSKKYFYLHLFLQPFNLKLKSNIRKLWNDEVDYREGKKNEKEDEKESIDYCQKSDYVYKFFYAVEQQYEFPITKYINNNDLFAVSNIYY